MSARHDAACTRCGSVGKRRWIDDLYRFRMNQIGVILCDKCHRALMQADARAWDWFRESRPMKIRHVAALTVVVLGTISACSPVEHHTDPQEAMGQMTYSPEKCEYTGVLYYCNGEHALPNASAGMISSGTTTDTRLMRGICLQGFHYEKGGCQKD